MPLGLARGIFNKVLGKCPGQPYRSLLMLSMLSPTHVSWWNHCTNTCLCFLWSTLSFRSKLSATSIKAGHLAQRSLHNTLVFFFIAVITYPRHFPKPPELQATLPTPRLHFSFNYCSSFIMEKSGYYSVNVPQKPCVRNVIHKFMC